MKNSIAVLVFVGNTHSIAVYKKGVHPIFVDIDVEKRIVLDDTPKSVIFYYNNKGIVDIDWDSSEVTLALASTDLNFVETLWGADHCTDFDRALVTMTIEMIYQEYMTDPNYEWDGFIIYSK